MTKRISKYHKDRARAESDQFFLSRAGFQTSIGHSKRGYSVDSQGFYSGRNGNTPDSLSDKEARNLRRRNNL